MSSSQINEQGDRTVSENAAILVSRRTRRLVDAASGAMVMGLGAYLTVGFALVWLIPDRSAWYYFSALLLVMPVGFCLAFGILQDEVKSRRALAGLPTVETPQPKSLLGLALRMFASASPVLAAWLFVELVGIEERADIWAIGAAAWGLFWVVHGAYIPAWEEIVYGLVVGLIIWGLTRAQPAIRIEPVFCVGSLGMLLAGVIKHQRWRRWVRALPNPSEAPSSEVEE